MNFFQIKPFPSMIGIGILTSLLSACGGGGGGGSTTTTPTDPVNPVTPGVTCAPFIDSFGYNVSCKEMSLLPGAELSPAEGGGGGGSSGDGSGGDSGGDGSSGDGAPIANTRIDFIDINKKTITTKTDEKGYFRINLRGMTAPIVATVIRNDKPWKSMLVEKIDHSGANRKFYTINLTALTDKIASDVGIAAGKSGADGLTPADVQNNISTIKTATENLNKALADKLRENGLNPDTFNPLTLPFETNKTGYDQVLESVIVIKNPGQPTQITPTYSVGGTLGGSGSYNGLTLKNGSDSILFGNAAVSSFTFDKQLLSGASYNAVIAQQPTQSTCSISNGTGVIGQSNVNNIAVICESMAYSLGGTIEGLQNPNANGLIISSNGYQLAIVAPATSFKFQEKLAAGTEFNISIIKQPQNATCSVNNNTGKITNADFSLVKINCSSTSYTLSGKVSGLKEASGLVISTNGSELTIPPNATDFKFKEKFTYGTDFEISVVKQPSGLICSVNNGAGKITTTDIFSVEINCAAPKSYSLGGIIENYRNYLTNTTNTAVGISVYKNNTLSSNQSITLDRVCMISTTGPSCSTPFTSPVLLEENSSYKVEIDQKSPSAKYCNVSGGGSGTMPAENISNVKISCDK